jgi:acyl dehydratase
VTRRPEAPAPVPQRAPDIVVDIPTLPQQALLYRLCADRNPLHSDPGTSHALRASSGRSFTACAPGAWPGTRCWRMRAATSPRGCSSLFARFSAPVFPGETLRIEMHRDGPHDLHFRARVPARDRTVLDHGHARIAD